MAFAAMLAATMATATAANAVFSVLAPFLLEDLGIDRSTLGLLFTIVAAGGAATSLVAGPIADRWGGRTLTLAIFVTGIVIFGLTASSRSVVGLAAAAAIAGLGNGAGNPATNNLIGLHLPPGRRGTVMGVKQSGVQAGIMFAGLLLPPAANAFGWRTAVALAALVPASLLLLTVALVPPDPPVHHDAPAVGRRYRPSATVWWMTIYGALMGAGGSALLSFTPLYAREEMGFSVQLAGLVATAFGALGVLARIVWSRGSERIAHYARPLGAIAALSAVAALLTLLAGPAHVWLLWAGAALAGATVTAWNAVAMLAVVARVAPPFTGRATGLVNFGFLAGFAAAPALFGAVVDRTARYDVAWSGVVVVLLAAALVAVLWDRHARGQARAG